MKKLRKVIVILLLALLLIAAITVAACTPSTPHEHTYSSQWSYNETEHWHASTCNHDVTADRAAHNYGTDDVCDICGYIKGQGGSDNPTHQHSFAEQWSISDAEHWHAATCNHDVTADNAAHTFVNNVCSVCGYQNDVDLTDFRFDPCDGGYRLTKYNGTAAHVNIPDTYNDLPVVRIENSAFSPCENLISVTIPDSITSMGYDAFEDCTNLVTVNFGANSKLESIDSNTFHHCDSLTSITIPDNVTSIGYDAFNGCTNLATVNFGANSELESIGMEAFVNCCSLTSITIPYSVTSIGKQAFGGSGLTAITIPNSVTNIGDFVFSDCTGLTSILIPDSVKSVGYRVFDSCYSLVIYCETLDQLSDWDSGWNEDNCPVVWNCKQNNIADDGYVYDIADGIRYGLKDSQAKVYGNNYSGNVTIPSTVEYQGKNYSVTSIDDYAFYACTGLISISIPDSVTSIENSAFSNCTGLKSITIPDNVTSIGDGAFYDCENLATVNIGANSKLESIGERAFCACYSLTSITIPNSVISIDHNAFDGCGKLTSIFIPKSVINFGSDVFYGCDNLTVYCEIASKPDSWESDWNCLHYSWDSGYHYCIVVWGATRQDAEQH